MESGAPVLPPLNLVLPPISFAVAPPPLPHPPSQQLPQPPQLPQQAWAEQGWGSVDDGLEYTIDPAAITEEVRELSLCFAKLRPAAAAG